MTVTAQIIGWLIITQGVVGLAAPEFFLETIRAIQAPPLIYAAAVVRIAIGIVLVLAAPVSRTPLALRMLGGLVVIGGVLTPFAGVRIAEVILGWWSQGPGVVRAWATVALGLGAFVVYTTIRRPSPAQGR